MLDTNTNNRKKRERIPPADNRKKRERIPPADPTLLTPAQVAQKIGYAKRTFLEHIATQPDFPPRIAMTKRTFYWRENDIDKWLDRRKNPRPSIQ